MINFHHIFKEVEDAKTKKDKMVVLHKHSSPSLKLILGATYDPRVEWLLPEGTPPYTPLPKNSDGELDLAGELRKLYLFTKGNTDAQRNLKPERREFIFIQMLESLDPKEAEILIGMKDRKLPYKGITRKLVCDTFQNLTKDWK
jgi:hypothetical protein